PEGLARRWNIGSALLVPLFYHGEMIGVVGLDSPGREREFSPVQVEMVTALAHQATAGIQSGKRYEEERSAARTLQECFLSRAADVPHFDVASRYEPASSVAQIGGDYFDFVDLG